MLETTTNDKQTVVRILLCFERWRRSLTSVLIDFEGRLETFLVATLLAVLNLMLERSALLPPESPSEYMYMISMGEVVREKRTGARRPRSDSGGACGSAVSETHGLQYDYELVFVGGRSRRFARLP